MILFNKILQKIESMEKELVDYANQLISYPSLSGQEMEAQLYVRKVLEEDLNFTEIDFWEPDIEEMRGHEAFITKRENFKGSPNVVGTLKGKGGGRSLILNSHIDIVPEGNREDWSCQPFEGKVIDGNIYGRGVSDMKGTKAAFFVVLKALRELGINLKGDIIIQSVIEEESGSAGSLACALRGYKADAAILPEPSGFKICPAQQGSTWFRVNVFGKPAHGGKRYQGVSAIEKSATIVNAIAELEKYRNEKYTNPLYVGNPIPFTINVGTIRGGDWPSSVPEKVSIEGRMGIPPGEELPEGWQMFEEWIDQTAEVDAWMRQHKPSVEWFGAFWGSAQIDPDHPIVKVAQNAYKRIRNQEPLIEGTPWATDGRILIDFANTPALVFGPGTTAHCIDEHMPVKDLLDYSKMLACIILDWCEYE